MLIRVLYGDRKELLCNSGCNIRILINYIRRKTENNDKEHIDLAEETGLVVQLSEHLGEYADKYAPTGTYILVERQATPPPTEGSPKSKTSAHSLFKYTSLLKNHRDQFPNLIDFYTQLEKVPSSKVSLSAPGSPSEPRAKSPKSLKSPTGKTSKGRNLSSMPRAIKSSAKSSK